MTVQVTQEVADQMKKALFDTFMSQYQQMTQFINRLPVNLKLKEIIMQHFDNGFLWTKEAFLMISFAPPAVDNVVKLDQPEVCNPAPEEEKPAVA